MDKEDTGTTRIDLGGLRKHIEFTCYICDKTVVIETGNYPNDGCYQYFGYYETCTGNNLPGVQWLRDGFTKWKQCFCYDCEKDLEKYMTDKRIENMARAK